MQGLGNYLLVERGGALQGLSWVAHQQSTNSQAVQPTFKRDLTLDKVKL